MTEQQYQSIRKYLSNDLKRWEKDNQQCNYLIQKGQLDSRGALLKYTVEHLTELQALLKSFDELYKKN